MRKKHSSPLAFLVHRAGDQSLVAWWPLWDHGVIGRNQNSDIHLDHPAVSRVHAELRFDGAFHRISNLGRYGTTIDGAKLAETESRLLDYGSKIAIADAYILEYYPNLTLPGDVGDAVRGLLEIDTILQTVHVGGIDVTRSISPDRRKILEILHERHGGVVSRGDIRRYVVDPDELPVYSDAAINQSLTRLRLALDPRGLGWRYITSHRGSGWSLKYRPETNGR